MEQIKSHVICRNKKWGDKERTKVGREERIKNANIVSKSVPGKQLGSRTRHPASVAVRPCPRRSSLGS